MALIDAKVPVGLA